MFSCLRIAVLLLAFRLISGATVIVTYASSAGQQTTLASNPSTYTFDSLANGVNNNVTWSGIGSFNKLWVQSADQYGGAGGTGKYAVVGAEASTASLLTSTLTLNTPEAYVGVWLSALDNQNVFTLYQGATVLATFNVSTLVSAIGACSGSNPYCGNPNNLTQDTAEPFAYLNFYATNGSGITSVVFTNNNYSTGFEYDNVSVSTAPGAITGKLVATFVSTPEPATLWLFSAGLFAIVTVFRCRTAVQTPHRIGCRQ
jgi:hypothetical protein